MGPIPLQAAVEFTHSPLLTFIIGLIIVVALLVWLDLPAFIGLIISAFLVGVVNTIFVADF
ncbi:GntP family permease, partial [Haloarcula sp. AONF1]